MHDVVTSILAFNAGRDPERLALKYRALRSSPFTFLRGTCHLFYERLPRARCLRKAPPAWVCGDLHLENFGSYKGDNRLVYFDINDFDEAALAPATWDAVRFVTSLLVAADDLDLAATPVKRLCEAYTSAYAQALADGEARWVERETADGLVKTLLDELRERPRDAFLDRRTERKGRRRRILCDGKHALPVNDDQRARATELVGAHAANQTNPGFFKVLDVARRIAGTGSLGVERYLILVEGKGSPDRNYLLDLKQSLPSSLTPGLKIAQPEWPSQADRVVALQRRSQAVSMAFLQPITRRKRAYVLRDMQPSEDRVDLAHARASVHDLGRFVAEMGRLSAWAQLRGSGRQGSAIADELIRFGAGAKKWQGELLEVAQDCARQLRGDWAAYCRAYDAGQLSG